MNKITTKSKDYKTLNERFVIVPIKKHLAKFLMFDSWPIDWHTDFIFLYYFNIWLKVSNFTFHFNNIDASLIERIFGEKLHKDFHKNTKLKYSYYRKRPVHYEKWDRSIYTLIKIEFNTCSSKVEKEDFEIMTKKINEFLEYKFRHFIYIYSDSTGSSKLISHILKVMNIKQEYIKTNTLFKYYQRNKNKNIFGKSVLLSNPVKAYIFSAMGYLHKN